MYNICFEYSLEGLLEARLIIAYNIRQNKISISQRTTKPTLRHVRPAKTDQPAQPRSLISVFTDRLCFLQPSGYPKTDKREPLPYWIDVEADLRFCWSHNFIVGFFVRWLNLLGLKNVSYLG